MKKIYLFLAALTTLVSGAFAQTEQPIVTLKSVINEVSGGTGTFHLVIGGTKGKYIDVDCGYGPVEVELQPANVVNGAVQGTTVTCALSSAGTVRIYGDAADIDYFEAEGCYLRSADISQLTELTGLNLMHNELTALDLTPHSKLQTLQLSDNPFSQASPLKLVGSKPQLVLMDISQIQWMDQGFSLTDYPALVSLDAFANESLTKLDPSACPNLMRLTADLTPLESVDVSHNPRLQILNVGDTRVTQVDVTQNPMLTQLYVNHTSAINNGYKLSALDVTQNPQLVYLFCAGNNIESLDLSRNPQLVDLSAANNRLSALDLSNNTMLVNVNIANNNMGFATLPDNPGNWSDYYLNQRATAVPRSYKVGDVIDLSAKMLRPGTTTTAVLMQKNDDDFSAPLPVDPSAYTYADGKLTLNTALPDSVMVVYSNDRYPEITLSTTYFRVKTAEDYGKDNVALSMTPTAAVGDVVGFVVYTRTEGSVTGAPSVDFGNGTPTTEGVGAPAVTGADESVKMLEVRGLRNGSGPVRLLVPEGMDVVGLNVTQPCQDMDLSGAPQLEDLVLVNTALDNLDLSRHRCLRSITMSGNNFETFSLKAKNVGYAKTQLSSVSLQGNNIRRLLHDGLEGVQYLNIAYNLLDSLELGSATHASVIDISYNNFTEVNLAKCDALDNINMSHNRISTIVMPEITTPSTMDVSYNCLTLATLHNPALFGRYVYAPQSKLGIPAKGPVVDLSLQNRVLNGYATRYEWYKTDGTLLQEGVHYTLSNGVTRFTDSTLGTVYCRMYHQAYPLLSGDNAFATTSIQVLPMPTHVVAQFTTPVGGETARASLAAAAAGTAVFFDWNGDGSSMDMYELTTTYTENYATTKAGATVKVYTYNEAPLTVFSITGITMADVDVASLTAVSTLNLSGSGCGNIALPAPGALTELFLDNCNITNDFDLSAYTSIYSLSLGGNKLQGEYNLAALPNLQLASLSANELTSVKFGNSKLWHLDLSRNLLDSINFQGAKNIEQLSLSGNRLVKVDVSNLRLLRALMLTNNRLRFSTLPPVKSSYVLYTYSNQEPIELTPNGLTVDLSSEAVADGQPTTYRWFIDEVSLDENGNYVGEELVANEEYTVEGGRTTFAAPMMRVIGLLTNPAFPNLALFTRMTDLAGVEDITVDADNATPEYYTLQGVRVTNPTRGLYICRRGRTATKVLLK